MNKMIVLNSPASGFNKKKIMITLGILILFVLAVKVLGDGIYTESSPQVVETNTAYNSEGQDSVKSKIDDKQQEAAFFAGYRMEREKVRSKEIDVLSEVINGQDNDQQ
ncbi:MAG: SpoIIIAH-like family protein, partial [Syntrophomonadaceae bacterium]|nr:SpoIIIAH-like family protein [Syntrophomonadaceae bacterium]